MRSDDFLIPIAFFIFLGAVILTAITSRHRERMAIVEKGLSSEDIKALYSRSTERNHLGSLKWGILFILGGAAILLGNFLHVQYNVEEGVIIGMVTLFVGIGLVLFYAIAGKKSATPLDKQ